MHKDAQTAENEAGPLRINQSYEIKGLIVKVLATPNENTASKLGSAFNSGANFSGPLNMFRRKFSATVFYLPETKENRRFQASLREGLILDIHSFMPEEKVAAARHYPGTITFEKLKVVFSATGISYAIDPREACLVPGTQQYIEHVSAAQNQVLGTGKTKRNPCANCDCRPDNAW